MSPDPRDEEHPVTGAADPRGIERRLEALAEEMGQLIDCGRAGDREALHDYAVSLLRDRLPTAADEAPVAFDEGEDTSTARPAAGTNAATLIGYGFILLPASAVLLLVFPPVGMLLFVTGTGLMGGGVMLAVTSRFVARSAGVARVFRSFGNKAR